VSAPTRAAPAVGHAIAYGLLAVVGAVALVMGLGYGVFGEDDRVGPGLLPTVAGALVLLISVGKLVGAVRIARSAPTAAAEPGDGAEDASAARARTGQLALVFGALAAAVLLVPVLGLLVAFFGLSLFISAVVERRPWLPSALIAAASVAVVYAVFGLFLRVPLPGGLLGLGG
jgi:putative tricarboxylic transport membrane protein